MQGNSVILSVIFEFTATYCSRFMWCFLSIAIYFWAIYTYFCYTFEYDKKFSFEKPTLLNTKASENPH